MRDLNVHKIIDNFFHDGFWVKLWKVKVEGLKTIHSKHFDGRDGYCGEKCKMCTKSIVS